MFEEPNKDLKQNREPQTFQEVTSGVRLQREGRRLQAKALFKKRSKHALRGIRGIWLSFEVFNLMDVKNVASNTWIKDFSNRSYAIPNVLTSRRFNVRFKIDF